MPVMNRRAARRDIAEAPIIKALVAVGCSVVQLSDRGIPDLLVAYPVRSDLETINRYDTVLLEVKTGNAKLTDNELAFMMSWKGQFIICRTPDEALTLLGLK